MSLPGVTFNLACGKGVTELQNFTNLRLSSFAESHQMQQKNFDVSPKVVVHIYTDTNLADTLPLIGMQVQTFEECFIFPVVI